MKAAHLPAVGTPCPNCSTPLQGAFCHQCGQNADRHRRSLRHLVSEAAEDLVKFDGRLFRTLPDLFIRPGRLARDYVEGRIMRHVPPLRLFFVALVVFIFAAEHAVDVRREAADRRAEVIEQQLRTPQGRAAEAARLRAAANRELGEALREAESERDRALARAGSDRTVIETDHARKRAAIQAAYGQVQDQAARIERGEGSVGNTLLDAVNINTAGRADSEWLRSGVSRAIGNPDYFATLIFTWVHRLAILLLPIVTLCLAIGWRRRELFLYDHALVAMTVLSFAFLAAAIGLVLPAPLLGPWFGLLAIWIPINLFQAIRGAYAASVGGAILRVLLVSLVVALSLAGLVRVLMIVTLREI